MAVQSNEGSAPSGSTPVPDLIERYRLRRDAWIAQADELARLRDEVRGSAEREAMEIVTNARREVRRVVTEARRELLVLSAQVQAALGEVNASADPATLLHKAGIALGDGEESGQSEGSAEAFEPEQAVDEILNEVNGDIDALDEDARTLPLQAVPPLKLSTQNETSAVPDAHDAETTPIAAPVGAFAKEPPRESPAAVPEKSARFLLSPFPSEAVPVPSGKPLRTFVGAFVGVGIVVVLGTMWWLGRGRSEGSASPESVAAAPGDAPAGLESAPTEKVVESQPGTPVSASSSNTSGLTLGVEAIREVWVRATVDGRSDLGRTMAAGQTVDLSAEQSIALRAGDAGALVVSVNHGQKQPLGRDGQVITRQFVVDGRKEPAPVSAPQAAPVPESPTRGTVGPPTASLSPEITPGDLPPLPTPAVASPTSASTVPSNLFPRVENVAAPALPPVTVTQTLPPPPQTPVASAASTSAAAATSPATAVVAAARQWLDAYHRQDRAAMAALSTENLLLADERRSDERLPPGLTDVTRTLDRVSVQIAADTAVLTAVMTEQSSSVATARISPVSQVWVLAGGGQWKVRQARFVSEARLNQVFR